LLIQGLDEINLHAVDTPDGVGTLALYTFGRPQRITCPLSSVFARAALGMTTASRLAHPMKLIERLAFTADSAGLLRYHQTISEARDAEILRSGAPGSSGV
jgi:hypothetical protein